MGGVVHPRSGNVRKKQTGAVDLKILMVGDASMIYFCAERLMRTIDSLDAEDMARTLDKIEGACRNFRRWVQHARDAKKL